MTISFRPLSDGDYDALAELLNEASAAEGHPVAQSGAEFREEFESFGVDLSAHTFGAWHGESLVGVAYVVHVPSETRHEVSYVFGAVSPGFRGRGIGRRLFGEGLVVAERLLRASSSPVPKFVRAEAWQTNPTAMRLFERAGLRPARYFADLRRSLVDVPKPLPIEGVRVVPWDFSRNDEALEVKNLAFLDHWGSVPMTPDWWKSHTTGIGSRLDLSFFAVGSDDKIVGYAFSRRFPDDDSLLGGKFAWVDNVGTLAEWRGRGIATQLITAALNAYRDAGLEHAAINVDSDNPTGAYRLYESLGFSRWRETVVYWREVPRP